MSRPCFTDTWLWLSIRDQEPKWENVCDDATFVFDLWSLETSSPYDVGRKWTETLQVANKKDETQPGAGRTKRTNMSSCLSLKAMRMPRQSNIERGKWRTKCRQQLSQQHIEEKLGIAVAPSQVRLHSTLEDGYSWQVLDDKKYLFSKNLSDHTAKSYKELCDGIGVSFEAVRALPESTPGQGAFSSIEPEPPSFTSRINELQVQNDYLGQQLNFLKFQLEAEIKPRLSVEEKQKLADERAENVQKKLEAATSREDYFRSTALRYSRAFSKLVPIVSDLQQNPGITDDGCM
ncbi:hypothetical protein GGR54DRAFT_638170 [Hypoxylon sp. NC1633]|nr:hypothetical protein GGR54DRAFT_638170 [Hypoxylon sp. NC1633]